MRLTLPSISFFLLLILLKLLLDWSYVNFVSVLFGYAGFDLNIDAIKYLESWALYFLAAIFLNHQLRNPSDFLLFIFFSITLAPMLTLFGLSVQSRLYMYSVVLVFVMIGTILKIPDIKIPHVKNGNTLMLTVTVLFISVSLAQMFVSGSFTRINFDLSKVYDFRDVVGEKLITGLWAYIVPWTTKIFTIILLAYALLKKKYLIALGLILFQILLFGITSHKAVAVYPVFAIGLYIFRNSRYINLYIIASLILFLTLCILTYIIFDSKILPSLFLRRLFFVPALLKYQYFEFFSNNQYVLWSNSIFSSFIDYPYSLPPVNLMGSFYYGKPEMGANTGFIATSYMHFGFLGMFFIGFAVAILLKLADTFAMGNKPAWFYLSFLSVPFFGLFVNAAFLTSLLTHGLGIAFLMAWLSYKKKKVN